MNKIGKIAIVLALIVTVTAVLVIKNNKPIPVAAPATPPPTISPAPVSTALPRLVELGSVSCIPCKMMAPILEELRKEFPGSLQVDFIDVNVDRAAAAQFEIRVIPTQVFLNADGKEIFRHEGFYPKAEILAKWKDLGVNLQAGKQ